MDQIGTYYLKTESRFADVYDRFDKIDLRFNDIDRCFEDMKRYFDVCVETIRHDLLGANKDKIESHEDRIRRLERHAGFATAA